MTRGVLYCVVVMGICADGIDFLVQDVHSFAEHFVTKEARHTHCSCYESPTALGNVLSLRQPLKSHCVRKCVVTAPAFSTSLQHIS